MLKLSNSLLLLMFCFGCGGSDLPDLYETSGTATMAGEPVPVGASIVMTPTAGGRPSYGEVDKEGKFKMRCTADAAGAVAGENIVSLMEPNPMPDTPPPTKEQQPIFQKYAQGKSTMKVTIGESKTDWDLKFD